MTDHDISQNPYERQTQITGQESAPEGESLSSAPGYSGKRPGKKGGRGLFLLLGIVIGIVIAAAAAYPLASFYCMYTGHNILIDGSGMTKSSTDILTDDLISKIEELEQRIDLFYDGDISEEDLEDGVLHGLVSALGDPYSVYYTKEEYEDLEISTTGQYYGIGAGLLQDADTMVVSISKVYAGTPAEEAGLKKGDIVVSADGTDATSMELSDFVQLIRGEEGTTVHLEIIRDSETLEFDVERRNVTVPSVDSKMLDGNMGYIQISQWQSETSEEFKAAYEKLQSEGMEGLIVDLRGNTGGLLEVVVDCLDYILPEGTIVYTEDKYGTRKNFVSDESCIDIPMVVLTDGYSASASEIFAGAVKDYNYATLVGTKTFGKGIVQSLYTLEDGDAVKLTTAKYFTPNGNYIHGVGIEPDVEIEYEWTGPEDAETYDMQYDNQLQKGIEVLQEKMEQ